MRVRSIIATCAALAVVAVSITVRAGGPFVVDSVNNSGVAQAWNDNTLKWCPDPGDLSSTVGHAEAVQWITEALNKWAGVKLRNADNQSVDTTSIKIMQDSDCPTEDIDADNFSDYYNGDSGPTVVAFDETGDIVAMIVGEQNREGVVGLSVPLVSDSSGLHITKGIAIFNGLLLAADNTTLGYDLSTKSSYFKATVLHELGHLLNLDHSQSNYEYIKTCEMGESCEYSSYIPTMYPELISTTQSSLNRDDQVTMSWLYPTQDFIDQFCTITGAIYDDDGDPLKGVHVTATRAQGTSTPLVEARSFVSGALYPSCYGDSRYYLYGIVPGRAYKVYYEAIGSEFSGASDFEPLDNPPSGFESGTIEGPDGETTVTCEEGGEVIEMKDVQIATSNPCVSTSSGGGDSSTTTSSSKLSCQLAPKSSPGFAEAIFVFLALMSVAGFRKIASIRAKRNNS